MEPQRLCRSPIADWFPFFAALAAAGVVLALMYQTGRVRSVFDHWALVGLVMLIVWRVTGKVIWRKKRG